MVRSDGALIAGGRPLRAVWLDQDARAAISPLLRGEPITVDAANGELVERLVDLELLHPVPEAAEPHHGLVTVVVPVRDHASELRELLSVTDAFWGVGAVIVVDDASRDPQAVREAVAEASHAEVELVRCERRHGPAAARNRGATRATTELVAFVDADCRPGARWLEALLAHFDDPAVAVVAPRVRAELARDGRQVRAWRPLLGFERARSPLDFGPEPGPVGPGRGLALVPSAAMLVRRRAFEAVGGFDPTLRFGEDTDLVWRLAEAGWTVRYEPSVVVGHPMRHGLAAVLRQRFDYGLPAAALARRHRRFRLLHVEPLTVLAMAATLTGDLGVATTAGLVGLVVPVARGVGAGMGWREALRLRAREQMADAKGLAASLWRTYWPLTAVLCAWNRRFRRMALAALVAVPLVERVRTRCAVPVAWWTVLHAAGELASGAGVWVGCARARNVSVLVPAWKKWGWRVCSVGET